MLPTNLWKDADITQEQRDKFIERFWNCFVKVEGVTKYVKFKPCSTDSIFHIMRNWRIAVLKPNFLAFNRPETWDTNFWSSPRTLLGRQFPHSMQNAHENGAALPRDLWANRVEYDREFFLLVCVLDTGRTDKRIRVPLRVFAYFQRLLLDELMDEAMRQRTYKLFRHDEIPVERSPLVARVVFDKTFRGTARSDRTGDVRDAAKGNFPDCEDFKNPFSVKPESDDGGSVQLLSATEQASKIKYAVPWQYPARGPVETVLCDNLPALEQYDKDRPFQAIFKIKLRMQAASQHLAADKRYKILVTPRIDLFSMIFRWNDGTTGFKLIAASRPNKRARK